jgi:hypothetical protein
MINRIEQANEFLSGNFIKKCSAEMKRIYQQAASLCNLNDDEFSFILQSLQNLYEFAKIERAKFYKYTRSRTQQQCIDVELSVLQLCEEIGAINLVFNIKTF